MKRTILLLIFENIFLLASQMVYGEEYTTVIPDRLCPFTVDIYPKTISVGDPLYIKMNFDNNTISETYSYAEPLNLVSVETKVVAYYLKEISGEIIPWHIHSGLFDGGTIHVWQKVKSGEKGLTQYMSLGFPGINYMIGKVNCMGYGKKRWEEIKNMFPSTGGGTSMSSGGVTGQLQVVFNNGGEYHIPENTDNYFVPPKLLQTLIAVSPPIFIKARNQDEMKILDETFFKNPNLEKDDLERVILEISPGTLQNLLKWKLLGMELKQSFGEELNKTQILETFGKMKKFLKSLHEIECENLKRLIDNRDWFEERMKNDEKLLKKFTEVFGEKDVTIKVPTDYFGMGPHE